MPYLLLWDPNGTCCPLWQHQVPPLVAPLAVRPLHTKLKLVPWLQICTFNHSSWVDAMLIMWLFAPSGESQHKAPALAPPQHFLPHGCCSLAPSLPTHLTYTECNQLAAADPAGRAPSQHHVSSSCCQMLQHSGALATVGVHASHRCSQLPARSAALYSCHSPCRGRVTHHCLDSLTPQVQKLQHDLCHPEAVP